MIMIMMMIATTIRRELGSGQVGHTMTAASVFGMTVQRHFAVEAFGARKGKKMYYCDY
jgi:hypothetical protein